MKDRRGIKLDKSDNIQCIERCIRLASGEIIYRVICDECPACDDKPAKEYYTDWQGNVLFDSDQTDWNTCWYVDLAGVSGGTNAIEVNGVVYPLGTDILYDTVDGALLHNSINVALTTGGVSFNLSQYYNDGNGKNGVVINCMDKDITSVRFIGSPLLGGPDISLYSGYVHPDFPSGVIPSVGSVYFDRFCLDCILGPPSLKGSMPCNEDTLEKGDCLTCKSVGTYCLTGSDEISSIVINGELLEANYPLTTEQAAFNIEVYLRCSSCSFHKTVLPSGDVCFDWFECPEELDITIYNTEDPPVATEWDSVCEGVEDVLLVKECNSGAILDNLIQLNGPGDDYTYGLFCTEEGAEVFAGISNVDGSIVSVYDQVECGYVDVFCANVTTLLNRDVNNISVDGNNNFIFGWSALSLSEREDYLESIIDGYPDLYYDRDNNRICSEVSSVPIDYRYQVGPRFSTEILTWYTDTICPEGCDESDVTIHEVEIATGAFSSNDAISFGETGLWNNFPLLWGVMSDEDRLSWIKSITPSQLEVEPAIVGGLIIPGRFRWTARSSFTNYILPFRQTFETHPSAPIVETRCVGLLESTDLTICEGIETKSRKLCSSNHGTVTEVIVFRDGVPDNPVYVTADNSIVNELGDVFEGACPQTECIECEPTFEVDTVCTSIDVEHQLVDGSSVIVLAGMPTLRRRRTTYTQIGCECVEAEVEVRYFEFFSGVEVASVVEWSEICDSDTETVTRCLPDGRVVTIFTVVVSHMGGSYLSNTFYDLEGNPIPEPSEPLGVCNPVVHPIQGCITLADESIVNGTLHLEYDEQGNPYYEGSTFTSNVGSNYVLGDRIFSSDCTVTEDCPLVKRKICYDVSSFVFPCLDLSVVYNGTSIDLCEFDNLILPTTGDIFTRGGVRSDVISSADALGGLRHIQASNLSGPGFDPNSILFDGVDISLNPSVIGGSAITTYDDVRVLFSGHSFGLSGTAPSISLEVEYVTIQQGVGIAVYDPSQDLILDLMPGYTPGSFDATFKGVDVFVGGSSNGATTTPGIKMWEVDTSGVADLSQIVIYTVGLDGFVAGDPTPDELNNLKVNGVPVTPYLCEITNLQEIAQYLTLSTGHAWVVESTYKVCTVVTTDDVFGDLTCGLTSTPAIEEELVINRQIPLVKIGCTEGLGGSFSKDRVCFEYEGTVYEGWEYESRNVSTGAILYRIVEDRDRTLSLSENYILVDCPCEEEETNQNLSKGLKILTDKITSSNATGGGSSVSVLKNELCFEFNGRLFKGWEIEGFDSEGVSLFRKARSIDGSTETSSYQIVECPCANQVLQFPRAIDDSGYEMIYGSVDALVVQVSFNDLLCGNGSVTDFRLRIGSEINVVVTPQISLTGEFYTMPVNTGAWSFEYDIYCDGLYSGQTATVSGTTITSLAATEDYMGYVLPGVTTQVDTTANDTLCSSGVTTWQVVSGSEVNAVVSDNPIDIDGTFDVTPITDGPFEFYYELLCDGVPSGEIARVYGEAVSPSVSLVKTADVQGLGLAGDTILYTFVVTNTGSVDLTNIVVTDPLITVSGGPISLLVGESDSTTFTATYVITASDIVAGQVVNQATVVATAPNGLGTVIDLSNEVTISLVSPPTPPGNNYDPDEVDFCNHFDEITFAGLFDGNTTQATTVGVINDYRLHQNCTMSWDFLTPYTIADTIQVYWSNAQQAGNDPDEIIGIDILVSDNGGATFTVFPSPTELVPSITGDQVFDIAPNMNFNWVGIRSILTEDVGADPYIWEITISNTPNV